MKKKRDLTPELSQLKDRLKAIEAEVKSKDEEIEDLREQVEIVQNEKEWSNIQNYKNKILTILNWLPLKQFIFTRTLVPLKYNRFTSSKISCHRLHVLKWEVYTHQTMNFNH